MKVFLSYSLNDTELYVLTLLARRFRESGYTTTSSYNLNSDAINDDTYVQLTGSSFFLGIMSNNGNHWQRVTDEWALAINFKIPSLLLVEEGVSLYPEYNNHPNIARFNRNNPQMAIDRVNQKIIESQNIHQSDNSLAWLIGGFAVLGAIALLTKDD